jgi:hypothetical protein
MPVLNLAQDGLDVGGHRTTAFAGIDNRNRRGRDVVREISSRRRFLRRPSYAIQIMKPETPQPSPEPKPLSPAAAKTADSLRRIKAIQALQPAAPKPK